MKEKVEAELISPTHRLSRGGVPPSGSKNSSAKNTAGPQFFPAKTSI
jgi:hypothetical protein